MIGERILYQAGEVARTFGLTEVRLYTNAAFAPNAAFYTKRGFEEYRRGSTIPGTITAFMRKALNRTE
jgi:hypothetical protein